MLECAHENDCCQRSDDRAQGNDPGYTSTMPKTVAAPKPTGQDIASKTPNPVAADLPPEKFSQIERLWPKSTASPAKETGHGTHICRSKAVGGGVDSVE